ncbi:redoxin domain-containing protein [Mariniblastus sp.]|nr:redoxin domain-containing protein [Mariniblastus sp.]
MTSRFASISYRWIFATTVIPCTLGLFGGLGFQNSLGQDAPLKKALSIKSKQDVDYERPSEAVMAECVFAKTKDPAGFVVHHNSGRILRRFVDTNGDNKLDHWAYFNNGLEVYRDLDTNFDGRTDQYRWLGPAGTRWGVDPNQDGKIDSWKMISAEEVAYECFAAIRSRDGDQFNRLLLTSSELAALQLGDNLNRDVATRIQKALKGFEKMARQQKVIDRQSKFLDAGNGRPQLMAGGSFGNRRDLVIYDQASCFFESDKGNQIALGSLVRVGNVWRMVDLPEIVDPNKPLASGGAFFPLPQFGTTRTAAATTVTGENLSQLYDELTNLDKKLASAKGSQVQQLEKQKADIFVQFYLKTDNPKMKQNWLENLADSVAHSYQQGRFDDGLDYLGKFVATQNTADGLDYVVWSTVFAEYGRANSSGTSKERESAYTKMISNLDKFQKQYPNSEKSADALIQLAVHDEVNSTDDVSSAVAWYEACLKRFPNSKYGRRSKGAITRLGDGKNGISFTSKQANGKPFNLAQIKSDIVILHFWETWCCPENDINELARLAKKYKDDLTIIGCNIEGPNATEGTKKFLEFLKAHPEITWIQLHEPGSVEDSPLAHELGISTEPAVFLLDAKGKLIEGNIGISNLEREIERQLN